jgi:acylphosphatase
MKKRLSVLFSGSVQGVGFRYTTERIARALPVTGFVRNLPDGQVEVVAEGEERTLETFLSELRGSFKEYVRDVSRKWDAATGEFKGFGVKF